MAAVFSGGCASGRWFAVAAVAGTGWRDVKSDAACSTIQQRVGWVSDAVRPGVIRSERKSAAEPFLRTQQQSVVAPRATIVPGVQEPVFRAFGGVDQPQQ